MHTHSWSVICLAAVLAGALAAAAPCQLQVNLTGVPVDLILPVPAGRNVVITATVTGGAVEAAWLARGKEAPTRIALLPAGDGVFQLNLATADLDALLRVPAPAGTLMVFAKGKDGTVVSSVGIAYALPTNARRPMLVVHEQDRTRRIEWASPAWVSPRVVTRIDIDLRVPRPTTDATAHLGGRRLTLAANEAGGARLEVTADLVEAWLAHGELEIGSRTDPDAPVFRLRARPERLVADGRTAEFECAQRATASIPGSRDYLRVSLGDITGGRVRLRMQDAEGRPILGGLLVRQGDELTFFHADAKYVLRVARLVNSLLGEDHAVLQIATMTAVEGGLIERLLDAVKAAPLTFVRNGDTHDGGAAERLLRAKYDAARGRITSVEEFITAVATRSSTTGEAYRVRAADGTERELAAWLTEQVEAMRAEAARKE